MRQPPMLAGLAKDDAPLVGEPHAILADTLRRSWGDPRPVAWSPRGQRVEALLPPPDRRAGVAMCVL